MKETLYIAVPKVAIIEDDILLDCQFILNLLSSLGTPVMSGVPEVLKWNPDRADLKNIADLMVISYGLDNLRRGLTEVGYSISRPVMVYRFSDVDENVKTIRLMIPYHQVLSGKPFIDRGPVVEEVPV